MVLTVEVVEAEAGRAAIAEPLVDLPKHAFGSCPICTQRLLSAQEAAAPVVRRALPDPAMPTRFLVQTSPVPERIDGRG